MSELPGVSAVVVNFNGHDRILNSLRALRQQEPPLAEIIVVDNGSTDGSPERIRREFPEVRLHLLAENRGPSAARNAGLRLAGNELVLLIDHDVYLERDALRTLLERQASEPGTVLCPRIVHFPERDRIQCDGAAPHFLGTMLLLHGEMPLAEAPCGPASVGGCLSACLLVPRSQAVAAGGFDEDYFIYFEDLEYSLRLAGLGVRFECLPSALAYHDRGAGYAGLSYRGEGAYPAQRFYLTVRNRLITILIHYRMRTLAILWPALAVYDLASLVLALRQGWVRPWIRAWLWPARHWRTLRTKRRRVQSARTRPDRDVLYGGPLPLTPGFVRSGAQAALTSVLSSGLNAYWRLARRWIG